MIIAVNSIFINQAYQEGYGAFLDECFTRIAARNAEHEFLYIADHAVDEKLFTPPNLKILIARPRAAKPLLWNFWYHYTLPAVLRKHKADIFVTAGNCSRRTDTPQCMLLPDMSLLHHPELFLKSHGRYLKKTVPGSLVIARSIVTFASFSKTAIMEQYSIPEQKIEVVHKAPNSLFQPVDQLVKEMIKEKYAEGKEFFLYAGNIEPQNNPMNILKAFSFFKKRQKSNMQLLMTGRLADEGFVKSLASFRYRKEVKLLGVLPPHELAIVTGAAYAMVSTALVNGYGDPVPSALEAMQSGVPVICSHGGAFTEMYQDAALYIDPANFNDIAEKMMLLFKDENLLHELIEKGKQRAAFYSWDRTTGLLWNAISRTANQ